MTALLLLLAPASPVEVAPMPAVVPDAAQLAAWVADLSSKDADKRLAALERLVRAGRRAQPVVPELIRLLDGEYAGQATAVLGAIGPGAKDAVPKLVALCKPGYGSFNDQLAGAIAKIDRPHPAATYALLMSSQKCNPIVLDGSEYIRAYPAEVVTHLVELCTHKDERVRHNAVVVLGDLKRWGGHEPPELLKQAGDAAKPVPAVLEKLLADGDARVRVTAARALSRAFPKEAAKTIQPVVVAMTDPKGVVQVNHHDAVEAFRPVPDQAVAALLPLFGHDNDRTREVAVLTVAALRVRQPVEGVLRDGKTARARESAAVCLGLWFADGKESAPALRAALRDEAFAVRYEAAKALVHVSERGSADAAAAVPALVEALSAGAAEERVESSRYLVSIGEVAKAAVPDLKKLLASRDPGVALEAALTLVSLAPGEAAGGVPALTAALRSDRDVFRATEALAALGPAAKDAVPELLKNFGAKKVLVRVIAAEAVARIDPSQAAKATEALVAVLTDPTDKDTGVRVDVALALIRIGPGAKAAAPTLLALLKQEGEWRAYLALAALAVDRDGSQPASDWLRAQFAEDGEDAPDAAELLVDLGPAAKQFIPELVLMLGSKSQYLRQRAVRVLAEIGPDAKDALPTLKAVAENDKAQHIRKQAAEAVAKIGGK